MRLPPSTCLLAPLLLVGVVARSSDLAPPGAVVISEISYHPQGAPGQEASLEFVELYNRGSSPVDLSGWALKDRDDLHTFRLPAGLELAPGAYVVLAASASDLRSAYGGQVPVVGGVGFRLGNDGETVRIFDALGTPVDQVTFLDEAPWPVEADGGGSTLERIDLSSDVTDFSNFAASVSGPPGSRPGTPGLPNSRAGSIPPRHDVVISEILYNPVRDPDADDRSHCADDEFVELFNRGASSIDISGWSFTRGISFTFLPGTVLEPAGRLVVFRDRAAFEALEGPISGAVGPFDGQLDDGGEALLLVDADGRPADHVRYDDALPWPINPDGIFGSLELVDPSRDNGHGQAWRQSAVWKGTPGSGPLERGPGLASVNVGPHLAELRARPRSEPLRSEVRSSDEVEVAVKALDHEGLASVVLEYQAMPAGSYLRKTDPDFESRWVAVPMTYDTERMLRVAEIPPQPHRTLVRYRVRALDGASPPAETRWPRPADPEPNLAYFVHDGVPDYVANERSAFGPAGYRHTGIDKVPVYHIIATAEDIETAQYVVLPEEPVYKWLVTFVHDGHVHDHIGLALRSGHRYSWPKRPWKVRFNRGNLFDGVSFDGVEYPRKRRKLHFMSAQHDPGKPRGESGVFESLGWRLFREAGVVGATTSFVQLRFVRSPEEEDQFLGDFFGIFLETQSMDTTCLEDNGRPTDDASRLYKFAGGPVKEHPDCTPEIDDVVAFTTGYARTPTREFFDQNLDVASYLSFRCVVEMSDDHDMDSLKNFYYYYSSATRRWEVIPWDLDNTFGAQASGDEPLAARVLGVYRTEYRNRFRFLARTLFEEQRLFGIIDGWSAWIRELADADLDRWNTEPRIACPGGPDSVGGNCKQYAPFTTRMRGLKTWIRQRARGLEGVYADTQIPTTPVNLAPGPGWPASGPVRLRSTDFSDPDPGDAHAGSRWLLIERGGDWAAPLWDVETGPGALEVEVPLEVLALGREHLFRVAHEDSSGRWSFLSEPTAFTPGRPDVTPPAPPEGAHAVYVGARAVRLEWIRGSDFESGLFGHVVRRDGLDLNVAPVIDPGFTDFVPTPGATHRYEVLAFNGAGLLSAPSTAVRVEVPLSAQLGPWSAPEGGFGYLFDALPGQDRYLAQRGAGAVGALDGSWMRARADEWDGSAPGPGKGAPGGVSIEEVAASEPGGAPASVLTLEDPGDPSLLFISPNNNRLLFLRAVSDDDALAGGVTFVARWRVHPRPLDLPDAMGQAPEDTDGRGQVALAFHGGGSSTRLAFWLDANLLHGPGGLQLPVSDRELVSLWATAEPEAGRQRLRVYLDGAGAPVFDGLVDLLEGKAETRFTGSALELGLASREAAGAIQVDHIAWARGATAPRPGSAAPFRRGDALPDGRLDLADALAILDRLYLGGAPLPCEDAADADDSGTLLITDAVVIVSHAFRSGPPPRAPFPECGLDPTPDALGCETADGCP